MGCAITCGGAKRLQGSCGTTHEINATWDSLTPRVEEIMPVKARRRLTARQVTWCSH